LEDKVFQTLNKPKLTCNLKSMQIIKDQVIKFNQITQG